MTVKITDTTMRDGHQSLLATRMRTASVILSADHTLVRYYILSRRNPGRRKRILSRNPRLLAEIPRISHFPFPISRSTR